jgi:hypothetical protein
MAKAVADGGKIARAAGAHVGGCLKPSEFEHGVRENRTQTAADNLDQGVSSGILPSQFAANGLDQRNCRIEVSSADRGQQSDENRQYRDGGSRIR